MTPAPHTENGSSVASAVKSVFLRLIVTAVVIVVTPAVAFLLFFASNSEAKALMHAHSLVAIFSIGWALLPLYRTTRTIRILVLCLWLQFGVLLVLFSEPGGGWLLYPWILASAGLAFLISRQSAATAIGRSTDLPCQSRLVDRKEAFTNQRTLEHAIKRSSEPDHASTEEETMREYGISRVGEKFQFAEYQYDRLIDAIAYAELQKTRAKRN
jgi:hypothetical protein